MACVPKKGGSGIALQEAVPVVLCIGKLLCQPCSSRLTCDIHSAEKDIAVHGFPDFVCQGFRHRSEAKNFVQDWQAAQRAKCEERKVKGTTRTGGTSMDKKMKGKEVY